MAKVDVLINLEMVYLMILVCDLFSPIDANHILVASLGEFVEWHYMKFDLFSL